MAQRDLAAVKAAAIDGRGRNAFYRKTQLDNLQSALVKEASTIQDAIVVDTGCLPSEARLEFSLALGALRDRFTELDPERELALEYRVAKGTDAPDMREPYGVAIIRASQQHTPFYSTIAPACAALAAGNCIVLQLDNTKHVPTVLKRIFTSALDPDSFAAVSSPVQDQDILAMSVEVSQNGVSTRTDTAANLIVSSPSLPTVAVVDRSADLDLAAQALIRARFSFGGRSPYSPDIVLVNEFIKRDFLTAVVRASIAAADALEDRRSGKEKPTARSGGGVEATIQSLRAGSGSSVRVVTESACGAVVDVQERTPDLVTRKVGGPVLVVHSMKSLDDAIDFLSRGNASYLAAYHFGSPATGKYLAQFVPAHVSLVNQGPSDLLVGPAAPLGHAPTPGVRYPTSLFSKPSPVYVTSGAHSELVEKALGASASETDRATALQHLYRAAVEALPKVKRGKQLTAGFGFFEHAFFIHFGLGALTTVSALFGGVWWLLRHRK